MRDFRDAKAMAHTLRAALSTKGHKVTNLGKRVSSMIQTSIEPRRVRCLA
jgi:hypothetical protein